MWGLNPRGLSTTDLAEPLKIELIEYAKFLSAKYSKSYARQLLTYTLRHVNVYNNLSLIDAIPSTTRNHALKALIAYSKFKGEYSKFHERIKSHGIKWVSVDSLSAFNNVFNKHQHSSLLDWFNQFSKFLHPHERVWLRYLAVSGLRRNESINSFNRIVELNRAGRLSEYLSDIGIIEHFRFKDNLRNTKLCFISIISDSLLNEIKASESVNWNSVEKRLERLHQHFRFKELRSYNATFLAKNGLISEEVDILQGRCGKTVFASSYLKEDFGEFRTRVLEANGKLEAKFIIAPTAFSS